MAFSDPQSLNLDGIVHNLPRTSWGQDRAEYRDPDGSNRLVVSHQYGKRVRRTARLERKLVRTDPITGIKVPHSVTVYVVIDHDGNAPVGDVIAASEDFGDWLFSDGGATVTRVVGGES